MPITGDPDALIAASEQMTTAAKALQGAREMLVAHGRSVTAEWSGVAAPLALERIEQHGADLGRVVEVVAGSAGPLATYADALRAAQQDHALGEEMVRDARAAVASLGSAAVAAADRARDTARQDVEDGATIMASAEERALQANEVAARALAEAAASLEAITPRPAPTPVVGRDGTLGDGLVKAGHDVLSEWADTVTGLIAHVNPFSDDFGPAWSDTWDTTKAVAAHPIDAAKTMIVGTVAPLGDSYRSGGTDEAIGRAPGVLMGIIGTRGLTKLNKIRALRSETTTPLAPNGGLQAHENAGGHTLAPHKFHIGTDEDALLHRLQTSTANITAASSFFDRGSAERSVRESIVGNSSEIAQWLNSTTKPTQGFDFAHDRPVGMSLASGSNSADQAVEVGGSRIVLRRDPTQPAGYFVLTAYPQR